MSVKRAVFYQKNVSRRMEIIIKGNVLYVGEVLLFKMANVQANVGLIKRI